MFDKTKNTRHISFANFSENAKASIFAYQFTPHLEVGYDALFSWGNIAPFSSLDWAISWQRRYEERGASPYNAVQDSHRSSMMRSETGLKFSEKWAFDWGTFFLKEKISYVFEKPFGVGTVNAAFIGTPGSFSVSAVDQNQNLASLGLGLLAAIGRKRPVQVSLSYEGEIGANYWSSNLMLKVSKNF